MTLSRWRFDQFCGEQKLAPNKWFTVYLRLIFGCGLFGLLIPISGTWAQSGSYIAQPPGQPPTYVNPRPGGGYIISTPGRPPTYVNPRADGGYIIERPGQVPTVVTPQSGGGGLIVQTPGRVPTYMGLAPGGTVGVKPSCATTQACGKANSGNDQPDNPGLPPTKPQN